MAWAPIHPVGHTTGAQKSSTGRFESLDPGYIASFLGVFRCGGQLFDRASSHLIDRGTLVAILHLMLHFRNALALPMARSDGDTSCCREREAPPDHHDTNSHGLFVFGGAVRRSTSPSEVQQSLNLFPPGPDCTPRDPEQQTRAHCQKWERIVPTPPCEFSPSAK